MGTSHAARAPATRKWSTVIASLRAPERNAASVVGVTFSVAMRTLPAVAPVSTPIIWGASEAFRFVLDVRERGLENAVKREAIRLSEQYVIPSISSGLWEVASAKIDPRFANSPFSRLAEVAFKKTMNQVMTKGVEALEEEQT